MKKFIPHIIIGMAIVISGCVIWINQRRLPDPEISNPGISLSDLERDENGEYTINPAKPEHFYTATNTRLGVSVMLTREIPSIGLHGLILLDDGKSNFVEISGSSSGRNFQIYVLEGKDYNEFEKNILALVNNEYRNCKLVKSTGSAWRNYDLVDKNNPVSIGPGGKEFPTRCDPFSEVFLRWDKNVGKVLFAWLGNDMPIFQATYYDFPILDSIKFISPAVVSDSKTYINTKYDFQFNYPANTKVLLENGGGFISAALSLMVTKTDDIEGLNGVIVRIYTKELTPDIFATMQASDNDYMVVIKGTNSLFQISGKNEKNSEIFDTIRSTIKLMK